MKSLSDYINNIYSQFGEDGIIEKIFEIIGTTNKICVEFGAWDGFHLSNTANLWTKKGWKGVLIEADKNKYLEMIQKTQDYDICALNIKVEPEGINSIDNILLRENITDSMIDLLLIDVDGNDYYIFKSMKNLKPRVVICEFNPTIPPHIQLINKVNGNFGCSALSLNKLAESKNYKLVGMTQVNCFFIKNKEYIRFNDIETRFESIFPTENLTYVLTNYTGKRVLSRIPTYGNNGIYQGELLGDSIIRN